MGSSVKYLVILEHVSFHATLLVVSEVEGHVFQISVPQEGITG